MTVRSQKPPDGRPDPERLGRDDGELDKSNRARHRHDRHPGEPGVVLEVPSQADHPVAGHRRVEHDFGVGNRDVAPRGSPECPCEPREERQPAEREPGPGGKEDVGHLATIDHGWAPACGESLPSLVTDESQGNP